MFISVPVMRLYAMPRRLESADVPLVTDAEAYHEVAALICEVLTRHGFSLRRQPPSWWVAAPTKILGWFGGDAFRAYVPDRLEHFTTSGLELSMYPSGILLRGEKNKVTWAHGMIAETVVHSRGYQTGDPKAQALEKQLRALWKLYDEKPAAHAGSPALLGRLRETTHALGALPVAFDDWQVVYRQILQVERVIRGQRQLLDEEAPDEVGEGGKSIMTSEERKAPEEAAQMSTPALLKEITAQVELLAKKQIELAKTEVLADLREEAGSRAERGVAALLALSGAILLLVTGVLALALLIPAWIAGSAVAGAILLAAAIVGLVSWRRRVRKPLARTRDFGRRRQICERAAGMSGEQDKGTDSPSSEDKAKALEGDIQEIRGRLGGMVSELDHRRHDLLDVKKQLGRHAVPLTLAGVALVGLAAGGVALTVRRHRQREALGARLVRFRRALARMIDKPERVANAPSAQWKMARRWPPPSCR